MSKLIEIALQYLGYPGVKYTTPSEGRTPEGFTCSGFVQYVLQEAGLNIPNWHSNELFDRFGVLVHEGLQKSGDLVFESLYGIRPNHVEFYITVETLLTELDTNKPEIPRSLIAEFLESSNSQDFKLGSPGKINSQIRLIELKRRKIPETTINNTPKLYNLNPIGYKRSAILLLENRYQEIIY